MTFDLEKARAMICHYRIENPGDADTDCGLEDLIRQANLAEEALDEIERLRAALDESEQILAHKTKTATHWYEEGLKTRADLVQSKRVVEQQAARLKELESLIESSMSLVGCHQRVIEKREKALVEERARGNHYGMSYEEATDGNFERWIIDGEKDLPKFYLDRVRTEAKRQLQAEGKIGPDADAKPHCWQITEERKAAISLALMELEHLPARQCSLTLEIKTKTQKFLRAMLTEADHDKP